MPRVPPCRRKNLVYLRSGEIHSAVAREKRRLITLAHEKGGNRGANRAVRERPKAMGVQPQNRAIVQLPDTEGTEIRYKP